MRRGGALYQATAGRGTYVLPLPIMLKNSLIQSLCAFDHGPRVVNESHGEKVE